MCGIAGAYGFASADTLDRMLSCIEHRGPDEQGTVFNRDVGLMMGARRLSIIDLADGSQPVSNEDGTVTVVFNGEIYNHTDLRERLSAAGHRFETRCDTEVLVHLWEEHGTGTPKHLDGMFAFAIWDEREETVFLARDRLGIKPLYYAETPRGTVWASELPAILETNVNQTLSQRAVYNYFSLRYSPGPETLVEAIQKVPPGASMLVKADGSVSRQRYWSLNSDPVADSRSAAVKTVRDRLETAIERRLMADVPLGAFLSGGLDSSAIVGIASEFTADPLSTFSVGFQADAYDESSEARFVADHFGTNHHETVVDLDSMDVFGDVVRRFGEPLADPAVLPTVVLADYASDYVKVVLTGEGADELFAGYDYFRRLPRHRRQAGWFPSPVYKAAAAAAAVSPVWGKYLRYFSSLGSDEDAILEWIRGYGTLPEAYIDSNLRPETSGLSKKVADSAAEGGDTLQQLSRYYIDYWLPDDLLYKVDHATMAASLEARVPFLDSGLVQYLHRLPSKHKLEGGSYKPLLSAAVANVVPERTRQRSKHGFQVPIERWFRNDHEAIARWLTETRVAETPYVDADLVFDLWDDHRRGDADHRGALWRTLNYVAWYHVHIAE